MTFWKLLALPKDFTVCNEFKEGNYLKVVFIKKSKIVINYFTLT